MVLYELYPTAIFSSFILLNLHFLFIVSPVCSKFFNNSSNISDNYLFHWCNTYLWIFLTPLYLFFPTILRTDTLCSWTALTEWSLYSRWALFMFSILCAEFLSWCSHSSTNFNKSQKKPPSSHLTSFDSHRCILLSSLTLSDVRAGTAWESSEQ
jgi:hypothetical protein